MSKVNKILFIINSFNNGGAEKQLLLLSNVLKYKYNLEFCFLAFKDGILKPDFNKIGSVSVLGFNPINIFFSIIFVKKKYKDIQIVSTWLYLSDFYGYLINKFLKVKLIWNIRHSTTNFLYNSLLTSFLIRINSFLSRKVDWIFYNSVESKENHFQVGYFNKSSVIDNGYNLNHSSFNNFTNFNRNFLVISRYKKIKGLEILFKALNEVKISGYDINVSIVGLSKKGISKLGKLTKKFNLVSNINLYPHNLNLDIFFASNTFLISPSLSESFSNVIIEASLNSLLCISTDVGSASKVLKGDSFLVRPGDHIDLKESIIKAYLMKDSVIRKSVLRIKKRIRSELDIDKIASYYVKIIHNL